jgi:hypothetical protein
MDYNESLPLTFDFNEAVDWLILGHDRKHQRDVADAIFYYHHAFHLATSLDLAQEALNALAALGPSNETTTQAISQAIRAVLASPEMSPPWQTLGELLTDFDQAKSLDCLIRAIELDLRSYGPEGLGPHHRLAASSPLPDWLAPAVNT